MTSIIYFLVYVSKAKCLDNLFPEKINKNKAKVIFESCLQIGIIATLVYVFRFYFSIFLKDIIPGVERCT